MTYIRTALWGPSRYAVPFFLLFGFFLALPFHSTKAAFGISPPFINADHLVKGSKYVQTIYLVQDNPAEDLGIVA